ncbi:uncharacterized protein LOC108680798 [Hyalella azteca]|uniref:Uncharacterized protein LOC108680798 n=1 Tax=Hyalella azteca TaxID=294128 RepID=A0A8B7PGB8_HYAAZ|nr:uncharacterized protein LOC108680798 [Hyalella azteca]
MSQTPCDVPPPNFHTSLPPPDVWPWPASANGPHAPVLPRPPHGPPLAAQLGNPPHRMRPPHSLQVPPRPYFANGSNPGVRFPPPDLQASFPSLRPPLNAASFGDMRGTAPMPEFSRPPPHKYSLFIPPNSAAQWARFPPPPHEARKLYSHHLSHIPAQVRFPTTETPPIPSLQITDPSVPNPRISGPSNHVKNSSSTSDNFLRSWAPVIDRPQIPDFSVPPPGRVLPPSSSVSTPANKQAHQLPTDTAPLINMSNFKPPSYSFPPPQLEPTELISYSMPPPLSGQKVILKEGKNSLPGSHQPNCGRKIAGGFARSSQRASALNLITESFSETRNVSLNQTTSVSSSTLNEVQWHPWNRSWVSSVKTQKLVDEWLAQKLESRSRTRRQHATPAGDLRPNTSHVRCDEQPPCGNSTSNADDESSANVNLSDKELAHKRLVADVIPLVKKDLKELRICDVHLIVAAFKLLMEELRSCINSRTIFKKKELLDDIRNLLSQSTFQATVRRLVRARSKKRGRHKRRRALRRQECASRSRQIDAHWQKIRALEQKRLQETKLRAEVDCVLKEVRGKQTDAAALQSLLWTLRDLRQHRLNRGEQQGYVSSQEADEAFARVVDGLDEMIDGQLADYALEERTLQAMLQSNRPPAQQEPPPAEEPQEPGVAKATVKELLFGARAAGDAAALASYCAADRSVEMLVARRRAWDKYIVSNRGPPQDSRTAASGVPLTWVLPPDNPSIPWRQYLVSS